MRNIILVTGGARSGKSVYSENLLKDSRKKVYIATAPVCDTEMADRVRKHQLRRTEQNWTTVEEELDIAGVIRCLPPGTDFLLDCLTLWISNLLWDAEKNHRVFAEEQMAEKMTELIAALKGFSGTGVFVLNEVGLGIVPDNPLARIFRDCSGRCGQMLAAEADQVFFLACGIPVKLKGSPA